ncbi:MAG TPA: LuxR C-terminal-related transcriptional regulator [Amycolatopsis sp.]|nr:LuxR C-terminal-related transcriptional regulator [Amycolatopsis sp.]
MTSFVGRRKEVADVKGILSSSRLVTLTGVGGVGKTRLACRVAAELHRAFADGVWLVELAEVSDPELVGFEVAETLGIRNAALEDPGKALLKFVEDKRLLIVLDNCEHLLAACGTLAHHIVRHAPGVKILATSREPLGILGETTFQVPPLSLLETPGDADGGVVNFGSEAVELFTERASSVFPGFSLDEEGQRAVAALCQRLDGIPLAIELAAVRIRSFSVEQLLSRQGALFDLLTQGNRGGPVRHQTLRGAIDWSFNLCTPREQALWARLSVFSGGFALEAIEGACTDETIETPGVLDIVAGLIDKSIIVRQGSGIRARYRMLESIKAYGAAKLAEQGDGQTWRRRHRDYYLRAAEAGDSQSAGRGQIECSRRLQLERANLRSALEYSLSTPGEYHAGLKMAGSLWFFWNACGYLQDGRRWIERALELDPEPSPERAKALWVVGWYAMVQGDTGAANRYLQECTALADLIDDESARAFALQFRGTTEQIAGNVAHALELLSSATSYHGSADRAHCLGILCHAQLAFAYCVSGELERALHLCEHAVELGTRLGELFATSWSLWVQGLARWLQGDLGKARDALLAGIELKQELHDWLGIATCTEVLTWIAIKRGEPSRGARLFGIGRRLSGEVGSLPLFGSSVLVSTRARFERVAREQLGDVRFDQLARAGEQLDHDEAIAFVLGKDSGSAPQRTAPAVDLHLTRREMEVAKLISAGLSNKEIAESLVISQRTAEGHVNRLLTKTGHRSRMQLAAWMGRHEGFQA